MIRRLRHALPSYEGRPLPRPDEDLNDQGLGFDLTTMSRRRALGALGLGAGSLMLAACGASSTGTSSSKAAGAASSGTANSAAGASSTGGAAAALASVEIPDETAGPYPGDGSNGPDALTQSGVVRSDIRSSFAGMSGSAQGVPLTLTLALTDLAKSTAMAGAAVYVWHADRDGKYSLYSQGLTGANYLRGVQVADAHGEVTFTTIFPGCYDGRWPHIHFEVYPDQAAITDATKAIATSQVALPKATCDAAYAASGYESSITNLGRITLATDNVFGEDGGVHQIPSVTGDASSGYRARLVVGVDTRTTPTAGAAPGGGPGGGPGAPGPR